MSRSRLFRMTRNPSCLIDDWMKSHELEKASGFFVENPVDNVDNFLTVLRRQPLDCLFHAIHHRGSPHIGFRNMAARLMQRGL